ncbi:MAG: PIG-L family deacetylase [Negativicutes bacterium]|nr:PIG-L family deacetylase [Negativicutes bacterium]
MHDVHPRFLTDVLAIGAHPDDVELGCGGLLIQAGRRRLTTAMLVLTDGAAGRSGSAAEREAETRAAADVLRVNHLIMLALPDGRLSGAEEAADRLATAIAGLRPRIIIGHWHDEWHPDHLAAHRLTKEAVYLAQLRAFSPDFPYPGPQHSLYFHLNSRRLANPDLVVDIDDVAEIKRQALSCHRSQAAVIAEYDRLAAAYGSLCNARYGEGFFFERPLRLDSSRILM